MIKKILRVTSIIIAIFVFILIWMHIDVTLGRKMEAGKNMPTGMLLTIVIFNYM